MGSSFVEDTFPGANMKKMKWNDLSLAKPVILPWKGPK